MTPTKIAITIRPDHIPYLRELREAGMNMVRLNGTFGTIDWHREIIQLIRTQIPGTQILIDIPGRKLRLAVEHDIHVKAGDIIPLPLPTFIPEGTVIYFDDGKMKGEVCHPGSDQGELSGTQEKSMDPGSSTYGLVRDDRMVMFHNDGTLRPKMGVNAPVQGPLLTPRDLEIIELAKQERVDFIGLSFIESSEVIHKVRSLCQIKCAAKIETATALQNLDDIAQHADAIIVARGDLSVECGLYNIITNQKHILKTAKQHLKIGMVCTGLFTLYPPQQSTIADIHNTILDGATYLLLSGDLPGGHDAICALQMFRDIVYMLK